MQLEIKTIIDFGDDGPDAHMNDVMRFVTEHLQRHVLQPTCDTFGGRATTHTGWTSSGDDEE